MAAPLLAQADLSRSGTLEPERQIIMSAAGRDADLLDLVAQQADQVMRQAWRVGKEDQEQPVQAILGQNGTLVLAKHAPRRIVTLPDGSLGLNDARTTITVLPAATARPFASQPNTQMPTQIKRSPQGATELLLSDELVAEQTQLITKITEHDTLLAQQQFALEQYKISTAAKLERLRIVLRFIVWCLLVSIPLLGTFYWGLKNIWHAYHALQKEKLVYQLQELASAERQIALSMQDGTLPTAKSANAVSGQGESS